ncbi:hypothetical protein Fcan01_10608 [Folsomia candida]|uniref:Uncharacterized protein n=1 Tax=Folsomia candida TaxID=158441 RepID=A0A226EAV6_FOLCA|nr:hypothetical protein Fcan01_10608 [Folsomia candida]
MFKLKDISWIFITILVTLQNSQNLTVASPEFANLLQVFQSCLIVLLDYAKTNWTVSSSIPIIRFKLKVNAYLRTDTNSSGDEMLYAYIDGRTVALKPIPRILCAVEFHLYPPIQSGQLKNSLKTTDLLRLAPERDLYHEGNDEYSKFLFKTWENTYYRILVTGHFPKREARLIGKDIIAQFYFICELCVQCHLQYVRFSPNFHSLVEWNSYISSKTRSVLNVHWKLHHRAIDADDVGGKYSQISAAIKSPNFKYLYFRQHQSDMPLDMILFKVAFPNATVSGLGDDCKTMPQIQNSSEDVKHEKFFISSLFPGITGEVSNIPTVILDVFSVNLLPYKIEGLEFTTCHQKDRNSGGISSLITPLDGATWLLILVNGILVAVSLSIGYFILGWGTNILFENMLYVSYAVFLEQSNSWAQLSSCFEFGAQKSRLYQVAEYPKKNAGYRGALFAQIICSCWILGCLVISNSYKGEYVKRQTVPRTVSRYSRFEELIAHKFIIYTIPIDTSLYLTFVNSMSDSDKIDAINFAFSLLAVFPNATEGNETDSSSLLNQIRNITKVPENYSEIVSGRNSLIGLVANCSKKIALASWSDHVKFLHANLEAINPGYAVSRSVQPLEKMAKSWAVSNWGDATVLARISGMMSSGLAQTWYRVTKEKEVSEFIKKSERLKKRWEKLKMSGNLREIYALFYLACIIAIGSFGLEIIIGL